MEQKIIDHCVKSATANQLPTIIGVVTKCTTEKSVMPVSGNHPNQPSQLLPGREQVIAKRNPVRCVDSQHNIHIN